MVVKHTKAQVTHGRKTLKECKLNRVVKHKKRKSYMDVKPRKAQVIHIRART